MGPLSHFARRGLVGALLGSGRRQRERKRSESGA